MKALPRLVAAVLACLALAACSEHASKTAERSVSPLIGTWTRDGDAPKPDANAPQFTKLTFAPNGTLDARYVAAGGALAAVVATAPKMKSERDTYTTPSSSTLRIAEGAAEREYQYRVSDGKLYLTPPDGSEAYVFSKSSSAN
jgi:hypothetical protein